MNAVLGRRREYRHSAAAYAVLFPLGALVAACGSAACLEITAEKA